MLPTKQSSTGCCNQSKILETELFHVLQVNTVRSSSHMKSTIAVVCFIVASATIDGTAGEKSGIYDN